MKPFFTNVPPCTKAANCALSTGLLLALSFYSNGLSILAWVALVPLGAVFTKQEFSIRCWAGVYLGGLIFHLSAFDWVRTLYGGFVLEGSYALVWLIIGQLGALSFCLMVTVGRKLVSNSRLPVTIALPLAWASFEVLQGQFMALFDQPPMRFLSLALTQVEFPLIVQLADISGEQTVVILVALVNGFIYDLYIARTKQPFHKWNWNLALRFSGVPIVLVCALCYGHFRLTQAPGNEGPGICLMTRHDLPPLIDSTRIPISAESLGKTNIQATDLFIWPELSYHHAIINAPSSEISESSLAAAWPLAKDGVESYRSLVNGFLFQATQKLGASLLIGCERLRVIEGEFRASNSLAYVDKSLGLVRTYDKVHCAPFREFVPRLWNWLPIEVPIEYVSGKSAAPFKLNTQRKTFRFGCGICYEVAFANHFRQQLRSSEIDFFVLAGSEGSDQSGALSRMLLELAQLRAIETRRPIVRTAHLGYSGWVDSCGRFDPSFGRKDQTIPRILVAPQLDDRVSLFVLWGNWASPLCICVLLSALSYPYIGRLVKMPSDSRDASSFPKCFGHSRSARSSGISLFELIAVVAILATLAILIVPRVTGATDAARERADKMNIALLNSAVERWYMDKGNWPASNLSDIGADPNYLPEGIPLSPLDGKTYKLNTFTHRVSTTGGGK